MNAVLAYMSQRDSRLSGRLREWRPPRVVRLWLLWATHLGDGWLWFAAGAVLLAGGGTCHGPLAAAAAAAGGANASILYLKRRFRRARPAPHVPNPLFDLAFDRFSFPSGHATNAFALSTVAALSFPAVTPLAGALAGSIALSRVVLGRHFLSDVIAGALLGVLVGSTAYLAVAR